MRFLVKRRFVLGPNRVANVGDIVELDDRKDAALIGAIRSCVEPAPAAPAEPPVREAEPQHRDPNVNDRDPAPTRRRGRRGGS